MFKRAALLVGMATVPLGLAPADARPQEEPLTLAQARAEARDGSGGVRAAKARARAAQAAQRAATAFLWPSVTAEGGALRSNDPVAAFGGRLRQGRFAETDFDPARLNDPGALTDWSGSVTVAWAPLDLASIAGRSAAGLEARAASRGAEWAERAAVFQAETLYLRAVGAQQRLGAATAALQAAEANARRIDLRVTEGLATEADALRGRAAVEAARARTIDASRAVADARGRLAVVLGWQVGRVPVPTDTAFSPVVAPTSGVAGRADLRASELSVRATEARASAAARTRMPSIRAFGRYETHGVDPFAGVRSDWTAGFAVAVPLFTGFAISAGERAANELAVAARDEHDLRVREARADVEEARRAVDAAGRAAAAAEAGDDAAREAARLMRLRYAEGLVTTADLLAAEATAAEMGAAAVDARITVRLAVARLDFLTEPATGELDR